MNTSNHLAVGETKGAQAPLSVAVFYLGEGDEPFVCQCNGMVTASVLADIDKALKENEGDYFPSGPGTYTFNVTRFHGQYGFEGRCELAPGWEFDGTGFEPLHVPPEDAGVAALPPIGAPGYGAALIALAHDYPIRTIIRKSNCIAVHEDGLVIGTFAGPNCENHAAQFAGVPELLEALKRCCFDSLNMSFDDWAFCRAAYTKAAAPITPARGLADDIASVRKQPLEMKHD